MSSWPLRSFENPNNPREKLSKRRWLLLQVSLYLRGERPRKGPTTRLKGSAWGSAQGRLGLNYPPQGVRARPPDPLRWGVEGLNYLRGAALRNAFGGLTSQPPEEHPLFLK